MKVRHNKARTLFNLKWNNYWVWKIAPYLAQSRRTRERNARIKKALDNM